VFVESGYHAAAMDDIADRAGVSKPVLYQHFPGKLDLYLALLDQHSGELLGLIRTALASTTDNKARVAATIAAYFEFVDRDGAPFRLVFESDLNNETSVRERVDKLSEDSAKAIAEVIKEDTDLPDDEAHLLGLLAVARFLDPPRRGCPTGGGAVLARSGWLPQDRAGRIWRRRGLACKGSTTIGA
jgi:AcrR family transcriptional regulator